MENIKAYILAGGKSKRFGNDKSIHHYEGKPLILHVIEVLKEIFPDITIVSNDKEKYDFTGLRVIPDIIPNLGPMGGIYTAIEDADSKRIFLTACDMPFLNRDFIEYMISLDQDVDIIVPMLNGMYEPMHAIYYKSSLKVIKEGIDNNQLKINALYDKMNARNVIEDEIIYYEDEPNKIFNNINYTEDIQKFT